MAVLLAHPLPWIALAAAGVMLALAGRGDRALRASIRERLWPVARLVARWLVLPVALVLLTPGLSEDMRGILIAALLAVASWFVTFLFQQEELAADQGDLMIALRAEIWVYLLALRKGESLAYGDWLAGRIAEAQAAGHDYVHFVPIPSEPVVFAALAPKIDRLPTRPVDRVIQFYSLMSDVRGFAEDLRSAPFAALPLDRRATAYAHFYAMRHTLEALATAAILRINEALSVEDPARGLDPALLAEADRHSGPPEAANSRAPALYGPESVPDVSGSRP